MKTLVVFLIVATLTIVLAFPESALPGLAQRQKGDKFPPSVPSKREPSPEELKKFKEWADKDPRRKEGIVKEGDKESLDGAESFYHSYGYYPSYYHGYYSYPSYYYPSYYNYWCTSEDKCHNCIGLLMHSSCAICPQRYSFDE